jgi:hypothetical protein
VSASDRRNDEASHGVKLLGDIRDLFVEEKMSCKALVDALNGLDESPGNGLDESPWGGWSDGAGIKTRELGRRLGRYGIRAKPIRIDGERAGNGYERSQFEDAWTR